MCQTPNILFLNELMVNQRSSRKYQRKILSNGKHPSRIKKIISFEIPYFSHSTILSFVLSESDSPVDINYNPVIW